MAQPPLAYADLELDELSRTDLDSDAEAIYDSSIIKCKTSFALGTEPDAAYLQHVIYLFRRKFFSPRYYEDQKLNGMGALFKML